MTQLRHPPTAPWLDGAEWGLIEGDGISQAHAQLNTVRLSKLFIAAAREGIPAYVGPGVYRLDGTVDPARLVPNLTFLGAGRDLTTFKSHPAYTRNGPIIGPVEDAGADNIEVTAYRMADMTIDGDFLNNLEYLTRTTLTAPIAPADTTVTVASTAGFAGTNRVVVASQVSDTADEFTYTSMDATHFYGVAQRIDSDHAAWSLAAGQELRPQSAHLGLMRVYSHDNFVIERVTFKNSFSYNLAGEGRPYDPDVSHRIKRNMTLIDVHLEDSYASDGMDFKDMDHLTGISCIALRSGDKGFNVRGSNQTWINCVAKDCRTGFGLTTSAVVADDSRSLTSLTVAALATDTSITVGDTSLLPTTGLGWIDAERVSWTGKTVSTVTGLTRGLEGTRAAAHAIGAQFNPDPVVADLEANVGTIDLLGCHAEGCTGSNMALSSEGSPSHINIIGGSSKEAASAGIVLTAVRAPMWVNITGTEVYDNRIGVKAVAATRFRMNGVIISGSAGNGVDIAGDGLTLEDCSNGAELYGNEIYDNAGVGIRWTGNTDYVEMHGKMPYANVGGPWVRLGSNNYGTTFGLPSRVSQPLIMQEAAPLSEHMDTVNLTAGTIIARCFTAESPLNVHFLNTYITTASTAGITLGKLALAEVSGTTATIVAVTTNTSGGWWNATGDKRVQLGTPASGLFRLTAGKRYAVLQLAVGASGPPVLAAHTGRTGTGARREIVGATAGTGKTDMVIGDVLTLTATAAEPYVAVEVT